MSLTLHSDLTGAGTDVLTLHPKVGHELSFFCIIFIGTLQLCWCCFFYQRDAVVYLQLYGVGGGRHEKSCGSLHWLSSSHAESLPEHGVE